MTALEIGTYREPVFTDEEVVEPARAAVKGLPEYKLRSIHGRVFRGIGYVAGVVADTLRSDDRNTTSSPSKNYRLGRSLAAVTATAVGLYAAVVGPTEAVEQINPFDTHCATLTITSENPTVWDAARAEFGSSDVREAVDSVERSGLDTGHVQLGKLPVEACVG